MGFVLRAWISGASVPFVEFTNKNQNAILINERLLPITPIRRGLSLESRTSLLVNWVLVFLLLVDQSNVMSFMIDHYAISLFHVKCAS